MPGKGNASLRQRQVVSSAAALFDQAGYHTTNMSELARAVGIEKPTLYHYFKSKDEILFWIHEEFIDLLISRAEERELEQRGAEEELRAVMGDVLGLMETHRGHVRVFFEHQRELTDQHRETIKAKRDRYERMVETTVERGIERGDFRPLDARLVTFALFGMCNWTYQWYRSEGTYSTDEIAGVFADLLVDGLRAR